SFIRFRLYLTVFAAVCVQVSAFADTPPWAITDKKDLLKNYVERVFLNPPEPSETFAFGLMAAPATNGIGYAPEAIGAEIETLARGLQHDARQIFEYCLNKIEYEHYWGSLKGATLTLLEGSGNSFDISSLMIALLRESGFTAEYRYGVRRVFDWDMEEWYGLAVYGGPALPFEDYTDAELVAEFGILPGFDPQDAGDVYDWRFMLNRLDFSVGRGYPIIDTAFGFGVLWDIPHVWVEVEVDGVTYELDPSFKLKEAVGAAVDLVAAMQYDRSSLLAAASGSTSADSATNLDVVVMGHELSDYTVNLVNWLRANRPNDSFSEIVGASKVIEENVAALGDFALSEGFDYLTGKDWLTTTTWTNGIPSQWMPKLNVKIGLYNYSTGEFTTVAYDSADDGDIHLNSLQGQKLSLWFDGNTTNFYLDESALASVTLPGSTVDISMSVRHPHGYFQSNGNFIEEGLSGSENPVVARYVEDDTNAYAFPYSFRAGPRLVRKRQEILQRYLRDGVPLSDWKVRTELLNITGASFMEETALSDRFVDGQLGVIPLAFHRFGRVAQEDAYYVDMFLQYGAPESFKSRSSDRLNSNHITALLSSALEHGILEQSQGPATEAVSTIKVLQLANDQNIPIFRIHSGNWNSTMENNLQNAGYPASVINEIDDATDNNNAIVLIPDDASITLNAWSGYGYAIMSDVGNVMKINELNGGFNSIVGDFEFEFLNQNFSSESSFLATASTDVYYVQDPLTTPAYYGADPVDMATGAFVYDKTDLQLGQAAPRGLAFARSYNSNLRHDDSQGLGYGWTHNLDIRVTERSAARAGLGQTTPYQAAAYLAAATAVKDLYLGNTNAKEWLTSSLVAKWAVDQLSYQGVAITMGTQTIEFVLMPDGSYMPPAGITMELSKDGSGHYILSERHGKTYTFGANQRIAQIRDQYDLAQNFTYTGNKLTQVQDAYGRTLTLNWSGDKISSVSDSTSRSVAYNYTGDNLSSVEDADGHDWTFIYDADHRITELIDPKSQVIVANTYDARSRAETQLSEGDPAKTWRFYYTGYVNAEEDPQGGQTRYHYDGRGRSIGVENALGEKETRIYDGQDHIVARATPKGETTLFDFDVNHNLISVTDPLSNTTVNVYDAQNRLQTEGDFKGNDSTYTYNAQHQVLTVTDRTGKLVLTNTYTANGDLATTTDADSNTTTYTYDSFGNVSRIDYADASFETFVYNTRGDLTSHTNRRGHTIAHSYDNRRNRLISTYPDTSTVTRVIDSCGNLTSVTDNEGNTTTHTYSSTTKRLTTTLPATAAGSAVIQNSYDSRDWLVETEDPLEQTITFIRDAAGRVTGTTDPLSRTSTQAFDLNGQLLSRSNAETETTEYTYNARGERTVTTNPLNHDITETFDANGNRTLLKNRRSQDYTFTHDANDRQLTLQTPLGHTTTKTWNDRGLLASVTEPSSQLTSFIYDSMGRIDQQTDPVGTINFVYDSNGNLTTVTEGSTTLTRAYDHRDRVINFIDAHGDSIGYQYDFNGNLTQLTYPGGKAVNYAYDARNQLISVTDWNSRVTTYSYDLKGQLTGINRPNGTSRSIAYNAAGEITRIEERKADGRLLNLQDFAYDNAGRITREFIAPIPQPYSIPTHTLTYDADNRIATFNGLTVVHDADGNMTSGPLDAVSLAAHAYDPRNRLTAAGGVSYQYDPENTRIAQTDTGGTTEYTVDPNTGLSKVLIRTNPDESKTYYVYGMGLLYQVDESENTLTYHYDYRGSTRMLTAADGHTITDKVEYTPYGTIVHREGSTDTPFLYNGMFGVMTDPNGLLHMRARYYNPYLKRFINADPIGFAGRVNWYSYASGNPISRIDPQGTYDGGSTTIVGSSSGGDALSNPFSPSEMSFFDANGYFKTGETVYINNDFGANLMGGLAAELTPIGILLAGKDFINSPSVLVGAALIPGVPRLGAARNTPTFSGTAKPWTKGATPNSTYTHIDPKTGRAVQNARYDDKGNVIGHVDFKNHGPGAPSGHGHTFPQPGNPASGHGPGKPHIPNNQLPAGWDALPPGVQPHTPIGQ
ncbi:MAG: hypothetical protein EA353_12805, partial [Puniceicoccaceae bacterium]